MSSGSISHNQDTNIEPAVPTDPAHKAPANKKCLGRSWCTLDRLGALLAIASLAGGIALLILTSLHISDFNLPGVALTSLGGGIFFLSFVFSCCRSCSKKIIKEERRNQEEQLNRVEKMFNAIKEGEDNAIKEGEEEDIQKPSPPISTTISPREFFESKGIFGVPEELLEELEMWRLCRYGQTTGKLIDGLTFNAGFILHGPPGTGKTTMAKAIATFLGGEYHEKNGESLEGSLWGQTGKNINRLFTEIPEGLFRVITIDEISALLPKRGHPFNPHGSRTTNHFLSAVDGEFRTSPQYILIGTTNEYENLDKALVRNGRLTGVEIALPNEEARRQMFLYHLNKLQRKSDEDWDSYSHTFAKNTEGRSGADIGAIFSQLARASISIKRKEAEEAPVKVRIKCVYIQDVEGILNGGYDLM